MAIENLLERIADTLERIAITQEENTKINQDYKAHLHQVTGVRSLGSVVKVEPCVEEVLKEVAVQDEIAVDDTKHDAPEGCAWHNPKGAEPEKEMTFEELKAALHVRGFDFPKGTKRTTLAKAWEVHKDDPILPPSTSPVEPPPSNVNPAGYAPTLTEAPAAASAPAPVPVAPVAPMTREEAQRRIQQNYKPTEDRDKLVEALASVGARTFTEVQDGKFEALVARYEELKGAANA